MHLEHLATVALHSRSSANSSSCASQCQTTNRSFAESDAFLSRQTCEDRDNPVAKRSEAHVVGNQQRDAVENRSARIEEYRRKIMQLVSNALLVSKAPIKCSE